jgi:hemolysin D
VSTISNDAVEWKGVGLAYVMRLQLDEDRIRVGKRRIRLSPGMAVTAEVKTGQRRLIEYFLSPLLRYRSESVRER